MATAVEERTGTELELEELWDREIPCEHPEHSTDLKLHGQDAPATVRGYAPCGRALNICGKFAELLIAQMDSWPQPVICRCGSVHWVEEFRFQKL